MKTLQLLGSGLLCVTILIWPKGIRAEPTPSFPFAVTTLFSGLNSPTIIKFADDGRIFIAEKAGIVKVFDNLDDSEPEIVVDISESVNSFWDRGLLGLALHPDFSTTPYVYLLFTYDAPPGEIAPVWHDTCPTPPGANIDGCVVSARLSRFRISSDNSLIGSEQVLLDNNWCQQFPSHSIGTITFDSQGALLVGAGDGANFHTFNGEHNGVDFGQLGGTLPGTPTPRNPCGDPPVSIGGQQTLPDAEGGALRSQDLLTPGDPVTFNGSILRVDPESGEALPDNPLYGGAIEDDDRIIAFGLRNPFRFTTRPMTDEIWIGDVGWRGWEEIDRIVDPTGSAPKNFGWPCYEGDQRQPEYDGVDLDLCETLYATPNAVEPPFFAYSHEEVPDPERCGATSSAAISGIAFYSGGEYPSTYQGALFFADVSRSCIWTMLPDQTGLPDPSIISTLVSQAGGIVHLEIGPSGDLFYVDILDGTIRRIIVDPAVLFGDGFESGDLTAWSHSPLPSR